MSTMGTMNEPSMLEEKLAEKKRRRTFMHEKHLGLSCMTPQSSSQTVRKNGLKMAHSAYIANDQFCPENNQLAVDGLQYNLRVGFML